MTWIHISACVLAVTVLVAPSLAAVCPDGCVCSTTRDGLHRATCSNLAELYKFTLRQKHHNINILDLSHNNITKLFHELDRLTEIVTLDLSTNGITDLNKFLYNAKKLVHLNLANNRITELSLTHLPASVSSLDLTNNLLRNVPSDLDHLISLEHLELEGNPLDCSCENIRIRDRLLLSNVFIDKAICATPTKIKGRSWLELKTKDICKVPKAEIDPLDMMMGDQPIDAERVGEETTALKSMSLVSNNVLEDGNVIQNKNPAEDDDSLQFLKVSKSITVSDIEGSGDAESTTDAGIIEPIQERKLHADLLATEEILPADNVHTTDDPIEGSGEGSGIGVLDFGHEENTEETTTPLVPELDPGPVRKYFEDESNGSSTEFPPVEVPSIYQGGRDWHKHTEAPVTERVATPLVTQDTTVSQKLETPLTKTSATTDDDKPTPHKTGTYVCIAIIVVLLVGLIGFAIIKGQMRKRRDRRLLRQQKRDVEKASKEMVDMNKSLLGKPAIVDTPIEKKVNGKYELVPTHESTQKKSENGDIGNGIRHSDTNGLRTDSPRDSNQNKSSSKDNNLADTTTPVQDTSFDSAPSPDSRKDIHSLSSEDIFVPINDEDTPRLNGNADSDISQPLINGDQNTDSDFLSPSREYVPVYSPDMGRVRIKMTETPKPKTPVLVTRSRSNAGDIIITPSLDGNARKSTT
ncbi:protein windpipe [Pectinophora gossypiella]|uniref:protein windpipe n=1 Tax=Pectinophora gossypiella TaxID=13191 RepID=UPI00214DF4EA|nr:protein windpipe [Pectinophora gossypiella]